MPGTIEKLIVNSAYSVPKQHWVFSLEEDKFILKEGRRPAGYFVAEQGSNQYNDVGKFVELPLVNEIRKRVESWRNEGYLGITGITRKLLTHWHGAEQRTYPFFFCQLDAIETLIWLVEAPDSEKVGITIDQGNNEFKRICSKMATGTGKTIVMAMLIAWQVINKAVYPQDKRFSKYVFIVSPGITVKNRLSVLKPEDPANYYDIFGIVPVTLRDRFNQGIVQVTNWHTLAWEDEEDFKKKRSVDKRGPLSDEAYTKSVLGNMSRYKNIIVINDEAHHAWKTNPEIKVKVDKEDKDYLKELEESSTVWVGGLERINRTCGIQTCYDFSATPFAPSGKKNDEAALFSWIVSDFGLNDAIESGLVKTPRMVVRDDGFPNATTYKSKLYHIYGEEEVKSDLSRPAKENEPLPDLVNEAYMLLGKDWLETYKEWKNAGMQTPPVMITVANRTETAARIKYAFNKNFIAIDELCDPNYILQIDSKVLKNAESLEGDTTSFNNDSDYSQLNKNDQASYLREKVNTVGCVGKLGEQVRNIISVSMLSEGWDTKTVTHIMGLRAFSSQLLCEQTIGRGLRRTSYDVDEETGLFTSEYVNVFGVPFTFLPQETNPGEKKPTKPKTQIYVRKDKAQYEIQWPNVIRIDRKMNDVLNLDLDDIPVLEIDASEHISVAQLAPFIDDKGYLNDKTEINLDDISEDMFRLQSTIFKAAAVLYDEDWKTKGTKMGLLGQLIKILEQFIVSDKIKIMPLSYSDKESPKWRVLILLNISRIISHIRNHISKKNTESLEVVIDQNHPMMSTADMPTWYTSKPNDITYKSHISHCVYDSSYEVSDQFKLDRNPFVDAWAKNDHLGFEIPYTFNGAYANYRPDFIIRLNNGHYLILETKGKETEKDVAKRKALQEWIEAINAMGKYGVWHSDISFKEDDVNDIIAKYIDTGYERDLGYELDLEKPNDKIRSLSSSVTGRIQAITQPVNGYINPAMLEHVKYEDGKQLHPENLSSSTVGLAVDYLSRMMMGDPVEDAFRIPLLGAQIAAEMDYALGLLNKIVGLDNDSIVNACRITHYDVYYRAGIEPKSRPEDILPDEKTCENIRLMVNRTLSFFELEGPVVINGPTFNGGYTDLITNGDGDYATEDTIWDLKVSKNLPTMEQTLQLAIYYLLGKHSKDSVLRRLSSIGIFNPRMNIAFKLDMSTVPREIIKQIEEVVIGYK